MKNAPVNVDNRPTIESYVPSKGNISKLAEKILCTDVKWKSFFFLIMWHK